MQVLRIPPARVEPVLNSLREFFTSQGSRQYKSLKGNIILSGWSEFPELPRSTHTRGVRAWRYALKSLRYYVRSHYRCYEAQDLEPLFLLGAERTGSHYFWSLLNSIPEVSLKGEILNPDNRIGIRTADEPLLLVQRHLMWNLRDCRSQIPGAKFVLYQLRQLGISAAQLNEWYPKASFVVIFRENIANEYLSLKLAVSTGHWDSNAPSSFDGRIRIEPAELERYLRLKIVEYRDVLGAKAGAANTAIVRYEDLVEDPDETFAANVFPLLGIEPCVIRSNLMKVVTVAPCDLIENFDQVERFFSGKAGRLAIEQIGGTEP